MTTTMSTPSTTHTDHTELTELTEFQAGDALPTLRDGTLVTAAEDGRGFLVRDGRLEPVHDIGVLLAAGVDPTTAPRLVAPEALLASVPTATASPRAIGVVGVDSGEQFLGSGHYMRTWGSIDWGKGAVAMQTRTRTITMFGGFHGSAGFICRDANAGPTFQTQDHRFGVDGTWVGRSDRTDAWWETMSTDAAARTVELVFYHAWSPDSFQTILTKWVTAGQSVAQLVTAAASVAKVFVVPTK
jgi:hypothetical protein